ncbi:hypothetical protein HBA93_21235, partial [Ochrobactrum sp. SFR4]|nr:hypothetical protein [Ochrobactrum sp. SFR4]
CRYDRGQGNQHDSGDQAGDADPPPVILRAVKLSRCRPFAGSRKIADRSDRQAYANDETSRGDKRLRGRDQVSKTLHQSNKSVQRFSVSS